jgi:lysophospholipase L1-like esterase
MNQTNRLKVLSALLLTGVTLSAQAQERTTEKRPMMGVEDVNQVKDLTLDSLNIAMSARPVPGSSRKPGCPVLFLVGNSTMRTGTLGNGNNGQWGWGYFAHEWFDEDRITVENHALGGTSSRTFYNRLWPDVLQGVEPGDWVIIELGHNDNGPYDEGRARASIPGIDPDTTLHVTIKETGVEETVYSYGEYLRKFIRDVRSHGAYPIIASLTPRNSWDNDTTITRKWNTFTPWGKAVAEEMGCPWIDLEGESAQRLEHFGHWKTNYMFTPLDKIHTSAFGARNNAYAAALAIQNCPDLPLKEYLKELTPQGVAVQRKPGCPVVFLTGDSTGKNNDNDDNGMWGWGSQMSLVFDTTRCTPVNCAKAGRSTRTYLKEGRWDQVYNAVQPGDVVLIQFGHNDMGPIDNNKERGVIASAADTMHVYRLASDRTYEAVYSFGWYLKKFIGDVREKGGIPVLLSLTPRNEWPGGKIERRNDSYGAWYRAVAAETGCLFVDVHNATADYLDKVGKEGARLYFNHDHTHTSKLGAQLNARSCAEGLRAAGMDSLLLPVKVVDRAMKATQKQLKKVVSKDDRSTYSNDVTTAAEKK